MSVHGPRPWWKRALFRHWSETVIATSESDRDNISGVFGVDANRIALSFLGVDTERFNPAVERAAFRRDIGVDEERPLIVHVSRFSHRKARPALALIDALPHLRRRVDSATLLLVGDGPELDRIKAKSAELNHRAGSDVVIVTGARTDIPDVMAAADVVVATATTALEAMAVGLVPVIANYAGPAELVTDDTGYRVPMGPRPALIAGFRQTLEQLVEAPEGLREIGLRARERVLRLFTWSAKAQQTLQVYRWVLGQQPKPDFGMPIRDPDFHPEPHVDPVLTA